MIQKQVNSTFSPRLRRGATDPYTHDVDTWRYVA